MLHIEAVNYLRDYKLRVRFSTGETKDIDLERELDGEVFAPLLDQAFFSRVHLNPDTRTVEWPNGADLSPEFLFKIGTTVEHAA